MQKCPFWALLRSFKFSWAWVGNVDGTGTPIPGDQEGKAVLIRQEGGWAATQAEGVRSVR